MRSPSLPIFLPLLLLSLFSLLSLPFFVGAVNISPYEQSVLAKIKTSLKAMDPSLFSTWTSKKVSCKNWLGLKCDKITGNVTHLILSSTDMAYGSSYNFPATIDPSLYKTDPYGHVLTGKIPSDIANLKSLKVIIIDSQSVGGVIPSSIGNLKNLEMLNLRDNILYGEVPNTVGSLKKLVYLDLSRNQVIDEWGLVVTSMGGVIPAQIWTLASLEYMKFSENQFYGSLPNPLKLRPCYIFMDNNFLSGPVNITFKTNDEVYVVLDNNFINGYTVNGKKKAVGEVTTYKNCLPASDYSKQKTKAQCYSFCSPSYTKNCAATVCKRFKCP